MELFRNAKTVRLRTHNDKYLTADDDGEGVVQVKLKTRYGNFLRANRGVPPWRNSVTHDVPSRSHTQDWILWELDVLEVYHPRLNDDDKSGSGSSTGAAFDRCGSDVEPFTLQPPTKSQSSESGASGRVIHYNIVDDDGNIIEQGEGGRSLVFKGNGVHELTQILEEATGLADITLCSRSPLNGKLYPMRLALPPNHVKLHIYVVPSSSKAAAELA